MNNDCPFHPRRANQNICTHCPTRIVCRETASLGAGARDGSAKGSVTVPSGSTGSTVDGGLAGSPSDGVVGSIEARGLLGPATGSGTGPPSGTPTDGSPGCKGSAVDGGLAGSPSGDRPGTDASLGSIGAGCLPGSVAEGSGPEPSPTGTPTDGGLEGSLGAGRLRTGTDGNTCNQQKQFQKHLHIEINTGGALACVARQGGT